MIIDEDEAEARDLLEAAGIGHELEPAFTPLEKVPGNTFLSNLLRKLRRAPK